MVSKPEVEAIVRGIQYHPRFEYKHLHPNSMHSVGRKRTILTKSTDPTLHAPSSRPFSQAEAAFRRNLSTPRQCLPWALLNLVMCFRQTKLHLRPTPVSAMPLPRNIVNLESISLLNEMVLVLLVYTPELRQDRPCSKRCSANQDARS